jgi:transposase InsO family protein
MSNEFTNWCKSKGITRQHTVTATPQQNGVSERLNCTIAEGVHQEKGFYSQNSLHSLRQNQLIQITLVAMQIPVTAHHALHNKHYVWLPCKTL